MPEHMPRTPEPEVMDEPEGAEAYALSDFSDVNQAFVDAMLAFIGTLDEARAVDLGTGPGDIPIRIVRARPSWHVVGVDMSEPMLAFARKTAEEAGLAPSLEWTCADAKDTGLPAHAFDVVLSNSILHHLNDTEAFWSEVKRLGKPSAFVCCRDLARPVTTEAARKIVARYGGVGSDLMQRDYYNSLLAAYTVDEVRSQLEAADITADIHVDMITDRHWHAFGRLPG